MAPAVRRMPVPQGMPVSCSTRVTQRRFGKALPSGHQSEVTMPQCHSRCATDAWKSQKVLKISEPIMDKPTVVISKTCKMKTFDPSDSTAIVNHRCCSCLSIQVPHSVQIRGGLWDMLTLAQLVQFFKDIWVKKIIVLSLINSKNDDDTKEAWDKNQDVALLGHCDGWRYTLQNNQATFYVRRY